MDKDIRVNLAFTADTEKVKSQLQSLQRQLEKVVNSTANKQTELGLTKDLAHAVSKANELRGILSKSTSSSGLLDLGTFNSELKKSGTTLSQYSEHLTAMGNEGQQAFARLATQISQAGVPLKKTSKLMDNFLISLKNAAKWQISSSILHGFIGSIQTAYGYAKDLNESLNNIRIVTGQSVSQMSAFAEEANKAAKALSATTTEYTNASLIYYQQGLSSKEVKERTDATIKMAHASGQSAEIVSDQMTAVWNNFDNGSKSLEHYADVMTALGAATASSSEEIAGGLEKFASIANMIGLSYEYAASALATITATTRQSEEVVGTALKTIFARIQGLKLGDTLEDGTSLNKYSEALNSVGISIKDTSGQLKDMDIILDEMGNKWKTLAKDQQTALAQTVAGTRQYNQLVSLMDNWDFFEQNLNIANTSDGALNQQAEIYAESWEAARDRVRASMEAIYSDIIDDEAFIDMTNGIDLVLQGVDHLIDGLGGLPGILITIGAIFTRVFSDQIATGLNKTFYNLTYSSSRAQKEAMAIRQEAVNAMKTLGGGGTASADAYAIQASVQDSLLIKQQELQKIGKDLTAEEQKKIQLMMDTTNQLTEQISKTDQLKENERQINDTLRLRFQDGINKSNNKTAAIKNYNKYGEERTIHRTLSPIVNDFSEQVNKAKIGSSIPNDKVQQLVQQFQQLRQAASTVGIAFDDAFDSPNMRKFFSDIDSGASVTAGRLIEATTNMKTAMSKLGKNAAETGEKIKKDLSNGGKGMPKSDINSFINDLNNNLDTLSQKDRELITKFANLGMSARETANAIEALKGRVYTFADGLVALSNVLMGLGMAYNTIKNLGSIWSNDDISLGEKVFSTLSALAILIPTLTSALTAQNLAKLQGLKINKEQFKVGLLRILQVKEETVTEALANKEKMKSIVLEKTRLLLSSKKVKVLLIITAIISALIVVVSSYNDIIDAQNKKAEKAIEVSERLAKSYDKVKQSHEEMMSSIEKYKDAQDALSTLVKGTEEYDEALKEANRSALELINKNPEDFSKKDYSWNNDRLEINEGALSRVEQKKEQASDIIYAANAMSEVNAQIAKNRVQEVDLERKLKLNDKELLTDLLEEYQNNKNVFDSEDTLLDFFAKRSNMEKDDYIGSTEWTFGFLENKDAILDNTKEIIQLSNILEQEDDLFLNAAQAAVHELYTNDQGYQNSKSGEMALKAGGRIFDNDYQKAYDLEYARTTLAGSREEVFQRYLENSDLDELKDFKIKGYGYGLVNYEYTDEETGEKKKETIYGEEIASVLAVIDATEKLGDSMEIFRSKLIKLNASEDEKDHALASFLSEQNLEHTSKGEYEALRNSVLNEDKTIDENKVNETLGLTGNILENNQEAQRAGYTDAKAYREAFIESLNLDWDTLFPDIKRHTIFDSLTFDSAKKIEASLKLVGEEGKKALLPNLRMIQDSLKEIEGMTPEKLTIAWEKIANIDWSSWEAGEQAVAIVHSLGGELDETSEAWNNNINKIRDATDAFPDFNALIEQLKTIQSITKDIELGSILSQEDYKLLLDYNKELSNYFAILADGSYQMIGDPLDFQQSIKQTKKDSLIEASNTYQDLAQETTDSYNAGTQFLNNNPDNLENYNQSAYNVLTGKVDNDLIQDQLQFLETQNYDAEQLNAWKEKFDGFTNDSSKNYEYIESVNAIREAVNETGEAYLTAGEKIATYQAMSQMAMNELALSAETSDERTQMFEEGIINEAALGESQIAAMNAEAWEDLDLDAVEDYAEYLEEVYKNTEMTEEASEEMSRSIIKMNRGIDKLAKSWEDWSDIIKTGNKNIAEGGTVSEEYFSSVKGVKNALSDILDVSEDFIDTDWVTSADNLDLIGKAAKGDADAIDTLGSSLAEDIALDSLDNLEEKMRGLEGIEDDFSFDFLKTEISSIIDEINGMLSTIEPGVIDEGPMLDSLKDLAMKSEMSVEEINAAFRSMGFTPHFKMVNVEQAKSVPLTTTWHNREYTKFDPLHPDMPTDWIDKEYSQTEQVDGGTLTSALPALAMTTLDGKGPQVPSAEIESVTYSGGGSHNNYSSTNSGGSSPGGKKSGGGKKGGHKKRKEPKDVKLEHQEKGNKVELLDIREEIDSYGTIEQYLRKITVALEDAARASDKLYGVKKLEAISEEIGLLKEMSQLLERQKKIAESARNTDKGIIQGLGFEIDEDGIITNLNEKLTELAVKARNAQITYNAIVEANPEYSEQPWLDKNPEPQEPSTEGMSEEEADAAQQKYEDDHFAWKEGLNAERQRLNLLIAQSNTELQTAESRRDAAEKDFEYAQKMTDRYQEDIQKIIDLTDQIEENMDKILEKNYQDIVIKLDYEIEINEDQLDRINLKLKLMDDNFSYLSESLIEMQSQEKFLINNLNENKEAFDKLNEALKNGEISQANYIEGLQKTQSSVLQNIEALIDLDKEMKHFYEDTLNEATGKFEKFANKFDVFQSTLEHFKNVMDLLGQSQDYEKINKVLNTQMQIEQGQLNSQRKFLQTLKNQREGFLKQVNDPSLRPEDRKIAQENLDLIDDQIAETQSQINESVEQIGTFAQEILMNSLEQANKNFENKLVEGLNKYRDPKDQLYSLEQYLDKINYADRSQEEYLTKTNQIYETNVLMRQAQLELEKTSSSIAKKKYQNFIKETEALQEQGKLSKFELEIAKSRYEVLQAQIALEEAKENKDSMRLVRNSSGNWDYVFTADTTKTDKAQQELDKAQNNLYNKGLEGAKEYQSKYAQIMQEALDKFKEIEEAYANGEITAQERDQRLSDAKAFYYEQLKTYSDLYYTGHNLLVEESYDNEADYLFEGIGDLESFKDGTEEYLEDCNSAFDEWGSNTKDLMDEVGDSSDDLDEKLNKLTQDSGILSDQIQNHLIPELENELIAVQELTLGWIAHREELERTIQTYIELYETMQNNKAEEIHNDKASSGFYDPNVDYSEIMNAIIGMGIADKDSDLIRALNAQREAKIDALGLTEKEYGSRGSAFISDLTGEVSSKYADNETFLHDTLREKLGLMADYRGDIDYSGLMAEYIKRAGLEYVDKDFLEFLNKTRDAKIEEELLKNPNYNYGGLKGEEFLNYLLDPEKQGYKNYTYQGNDFWKDLQRTGQYVKGVDYSKIIGSILAYGSEEDNAQLLDFLASQRQNKIIREHLTQDQYKDQGDSYRENISASKNPFTLEELTALLTSLGLTGIFNKNTPTETPQGDNKPSTEDNKPSTEDNKPSTEDNKPSTPTGNTPQGQNLNPGDVVINQNGDPVVITPGNESHWESIAGGKFAIKGQDENGYYNYYYMIPENKEDWTLDYVQKYFPGLSVQANRFYDGDRKKGGISIGQNDILHNINQDPYLVLEFLETVFAEKISQDEYLRKWVQDTRNFLDKNLGGSQPSATSKTSENLSNAAKTFSDTDSVNEYASKNTPSITSASSTISSIANSYNTKKIYQTVNISADFPGVTEAIEIYNAILELTNDAAQQRDTFEE